ncbi:enoyl-CoA hydratase-related protein [Alicyclobacillus tolerans]|uniref:Short chain enoyl-CoA hydratase n=2 Tax=Alicyclobacillus tolerans TaxID=90970 RepID=A0A1M6Q245_9BACL|nr:MULTISPECIES: enoyl-CoA hydratase-related protein [Alicyclobacillus]MDP9728379.1 enoyl-CoA hydratase/carnithine racemase [Alicyclobacillus tengchongensis]SHK14274.1 short chain enoyl-CoA hydratase [Alicyclobacillus montanus]
MNNEWVQVRQEDDVVVVTLHREEAANALSQDLCDALLQVLEELASSQARVVVLTGSGQKAFCAGADLKERKGMDIQQVRAAVKRIGRVTQAVAQLPMPTIAMLNGVAFGGGLEIALAADLRVAAEHVQMGLTETGLAIVPGAGGTQRLPRLIGLAKAKELIFTARRIDAQEAYRLGLVNQVVKVNELWTQTLQLAKEIAKNGPIAVQSAKWAIEEGIDKSLAEGLHLEWQAYERVLGSQDRLEGLAAFAEKRPPQYTGQ